MSSSSCLKTTLSDWFWSFDIYLSLRRSFSQPLFRLQLWNSGITHGHSKCSVVWLTAANSRIVTKRKGFYWSYKRCVTGNRFLPCMISKWLFGQLLSGIVVYGYLMQTLFNFVSCTWRISITLDLRMFNIVWLFGAFPFLILEQYFRILIRLGCITTVICESTF